MTTDRQMRRKVKSAQREYIAGTAGTTAMGIGAYSASVSHRVKHGTAAMKVDVHPPYETRAWHDMEQNRPRTTIHRKVGPIERAAKTRLRINSKPTAAFAAGALVPAAVMTHAYGRILNNKREIRERNAAKQASQLAKADSPQLAIRDRRYGDVEAKQRRAAALRRTVGIPSLSDLRLESDQLLGHSRGSVSVQDERPHPNKLARAVGMQRRSYVKPGHATKGQDQSKFHIAQRRDSDIAADRVRAIVETGGATAAAAGGLAALSTKRGQRTLNDMRQVTSLGRKTAGPVGLTLRAAERGLRNPRKSAAVVAAGGAALTAARGLRKPDTHEVVFDD